MLMLELLHVLAAVIWVGGMFFAHLCLRPVAAGLLEPPLRLTLWQGIFGRFFPWVWACVLTLIGTGMGLILSTGGMAAAPIHVHVMTGIGYLMAAIFMYIYFVPYRRLRQAVSGQQWPEAGAALSRIRPLVATNLLLGLGNIALVFLLPWVDLG